MERLKQKDKDEGVESQPMTDNQKAAMAEAREPTARKLPNRKCCSSRGCAIRFNLAEREAIEQELRRVRERYSSERKRRESKESEAAIFA